MSSEVPRPRVLLVGYGPTTRTALEGLLDTFDVVTLVRGGDDDVTTAAAAAGVPVAQPQSPSELAQLVEQLSPDCTVVSSYDRILPASLLDRCPFVNVHYAPLPEYRGRANVNWAIINRETHAAVTVHTMAPGLDAGGILAQERVPIAPRETIGSLYQRLNDIQRRILPPAVRCRLSGDEGETQDESRATYGCTRVPADGEIDWRVGSDEIDALIRAVAAPYPGAFTFLGLRKVWVLDAEPAPHSRRYVGRIPGRLIATSATDGWTDVLTGDGVLRIHRVRCDGEELPAASVLRGSRQTLGIRTSDLLERIADLERQLVERRSPSSVS
jgi:methionyl-tRNA formyltransferase